jgi:hypothetical protein
MAKVDLNRLKTEIDSRKRERVMVAESVQGGSLLPKDQFLNGLLTSLETGKSTAASNLIKLVENKTAVKEGGVARHTIEELPQHNQHPVAQRNLNEVEMSPERDELLWAEMEKRKKQTIYESIQGINQPVAPTQNNMGVGKPMNLNEQYLAESVKNMVNNHLVENLSPILEEAIKSTILEMYAVDRIKEVLHENRGMIKTLVYETIREIQAKSKTKAQ